MNRRLDSILVSGVLALTLVVAACTDTTETTTATATSESAAPSRGVGVVQAIDTEAQTLTIAHEPIESLGWPAMTMAFQVAGPELLNRAEIGDKIEFTLQGPGAPTTITTIEAVD
jgi:Cu(I)/Ag(I) efflux system protein CusF